MWLFRHVLTPVYLIINVSLAIIVTIADLSPIGHNFSYVEKNSLTVTNSPIYKDFSPSGEQLEHRKLAHGL